MKTKQLPPGWKEVELKQIVVEEKFSIVDGPFGTQLHSYEYVDKGIPLIRVTNIEERKFNFNDLKFISEKKYNELERSSVKKDDILISKTGTIGRACKFPKKFEKAIISSSCAKIKIDQKKADLNYILFFLNSELVYNQLLQSSKGTTRLGFNLTALRKVKIILPPPIIQKKLAQILEKGEKLKQKREESDKLTKNYLRSIFYKMFYIGKYKKVKLKDLCSLITKGTTPTTYGHSFIKNGINFFKIENIDEDGHIIINQSKCISNKAHNLLKRSKLAEGDIIFSIAGALGRVATIKKEHLPGNINQAIAIIRLKFNNTINKRYLEFYLKSNIVIQQIIENRRGVAQLNLNLWQVGNLEILVPPISIQKKFAKIVEQVEKLKLKQKKSKEKIDEVSNSLMQKAFKGELVK